MRRPSARPGRAAPPAPPSPWAGVGFVVGSGLVLTAIGRLIDRGALPWLVPGDSAVEDALPLPARRLLAVWFALVALLALVAPAAALLAGGRDPRIRRVLLPYVSVLGAQAVVERVATRRFFPHMSVLVGLAYTLFRLWQLRRGRAYLRHAGGGAGPGLRATRRLVAAGLAFWTLNLIFLVGVLSRRVVRPFPNRRGV